MKGLGRVVDALAALRPETLSVAELQASVAGVLPLVDRLGGWVDVAVGELACRAGGQVPAADGSGRAVLRERNIGQRVHQGQVVGKGDWEPVLRGDTYQRLVAFLTDPSRRSSPPSSAIKYLFSGLARCGVCAGPMRVLTAGRDGRKSDTYVCQPATTCGAPGTAWTPS